MAVLAGVLLSSVGLFPSIAPPRPDELLSRVAELVLRARLRESKEIRVDVKDGGAMLFGTVEGVTVTGRGWCTPQRLSCRTLDMKVGKTAIDFGALASQRRIVMQKPSIGSADISFSAADWSNFLSHPLFTAAVAGRIRTTNAPSVAFSRGGARLMPDGVSFPLQWGDTTLSARLWQPPGSEALVEATETSGGEPNAEASAWLQALFNELVLDLDGCALSFQSLKLLPGQGGDPAACTLALNLAMRVRSFPSLDVNF